jgi:hypothetical protein
MATNRAIQTRDHVIKMYAMYGAAFTALIFGVSAMGWFLYNVNVG